MAATPRRPTIYDVAERAGVSRSLVSLVLRGSTQVSEQRRAATLRAIAELGYRPSQAASMLAGTRTRSIEVLIDEYRNLSFVGLVAGIRQALNGQGLYLTVTESQQPGGPDVPDLITLSARADGRVLAAEPTQASFAGWNVPTVVAGHRLSVPDGTDVVANDDQQGSRLACEHLLSLGHRRIAHLTGSGGSARQRRIGYLATLHSAGLPACVAGESGGTTEHDGYQAAAEALERCPDITAIVAANDLMALGALAAVRDRGGAVPADVSVVGYDNSPLAQSRYLSLTTVDDRSVEVGSAAASALLARIQDPGIPAVYTLIPPSLVIGRTTASIR